MTIYANETNGLENPSDYHGNDRTFIGFDEFVALGGMFTRVRLLTEYGYPVMDISYLHGEAGGVQYRIQDTLTRPGRKTYRSELANAVKEAGGNRAQVQKMWDPSTYSIMR